MDYQKKLEMLKELDSTTDWQVLINAKGAKKSKSEAVLPKSTRKLTKAEKKRQKMQKQLEQVKETMKKKNVETIVYSNPDSASAKLNRSLRKPKVGEQASEESSTAQEGIELDMRKTRHEIIKFGMSSLKSKDLEDAEASLAISLGARPSKKSAINYKELQAQRKTAKELEKEMEANSSKPILNTVVNKKPQPGKGKVGKKPKEGRAHGHGRANNARKFSKQTRSRHSKS